MKKLEKEMELILQDKGGINAKAADGFNPLHLAAMIDDKEAINILLKKGADVNARDYLADTPLHRDEFGKTPLDWAVDYEHREVIELLIAVGAQLKAKGQRKSSFDMAACNGKIHPPVFFTHRGYK